MGITFKFNTVDTTTNLSNQSIKNCFYTTLVFWGSENNIPNLFLKNHLLGKRNNLCIINVEHHIEMLKRASKFLYEITKEEKSLLLFINDPINRKFDGLTKYIAIQTNNDYMLGKWNCGKLTKNNKLYSAVFFMNPKRSFFALKEVRKIGLPSISLNNFDFNALKITYPVFCNNVEGDSIYFHIMILGNTLIEGKLYSFIKNRKKKFIPN